MLIVIKIWHVYLQERKTKWIHEFLLHSLRPSVHCRFRIINNKTRKAKSGKGSDPSPQAKNYCQHLFWWNK